MIMPRLKNKLRALLKDALRVAIVGIGSDLRGDDAGGLLVLEYLRGRLKTSSRPSMNKSRQSNKPMIKLFNGGTAPENLTGEIRRFNPGHLIMIDAVDLAKKAGTIELVDLQKTANTVFLTHKLPIKLMLDFMAAEMEFITIFIGIQPKSLDFGVPVSSEVTRAVRELGDLLVLMLKASSRGRCYQAGRRRPSK
ncbi:hydrogenase 3 maturation endopeptidase HyCI [Verrucomicrobiota bacterium]